ncbi:hypothetical protein [Argonema antarcticum]|uniref:hypothetical protein n=1 Tax=Argonema antarcticum TaxID=2942763 RepID=UPI0020130B86|nr:hypothetical protein [Argonema antarcticum]MCL1472302.1 hypothetical protein [Argonema antarcticum A004/B2]
MKSAELKVLSAELKDRPLAMRGINLLLMIRFRPLAMRGIYRVLSAEYSFSYSALSTQHSVLSTVNLMISALTGSM